MNRRSWTEKEIAILVKRYPNERTQDLAADLDRPCSSIHQKARKLNIKKTKEFMRSEEFEGITRFKKGQIAWNKGRKMQFNENNKRTQFSHGHKPWNTRPIGSERISKDGYLQRKVTDTGYPPRDWKGVHIILWEEHNGALPKGHVVVFRDGNKRNIAIENLECLSRKELMQRNSIHNYPEEIAKVHQLRGALIRQINRMEKRKET